MLFAKVQNLKSYISLFAKALTPKEFTLQKVQQNHQQQEKMLKRSVCLQVRTVKGACAMFVLRVKFVLQMVELKLSENLINFNTLVMCD